MKRQKLENCGYGVASLVLGIMGLIIAPIIFSVLAVIFGAVGMGKNQRYSKAGLILGIIGVVIKAVIIAFAWAVLMSELTALGAY